MKDPQIIATINSLDTLLPKAKALIGLDGYVDKIQHPVESEHKNKLNYYPTLNSFGQHIKNAAGKSTQVQLFSKLIKAGGNAPIMAHALACLGIKNTCLGTFGEAVLEAVFQNIHKDSTLISVGKPATTNALEFNDGKLLLSEVSAFDPINWQFVKAKIGLERLVKISSEVQLIALVDWSNLPHATDIWRGVLNDILKTNSNQPVVFFDLCDPKKKSDHQIMEVIELINKFAKTTKVILGLNENEAIQLYEVFCRVHHVVDKLQNLKAIGQYIFDLMNIDILLIHPIDSCFAFSSEASIHLKGKLVSQPKVSTGGGDNFNAGFCFGYLNGFSIKTSMILAMATSGSYVESGESPDRKVLKNYLETHYSF